MYHHHSQQQGSQPFSNETRPPHQPPPNRASSDILSQVMGFQFPRPTQLPHELESALAIRGARDMDHRLIEHISQQNQHQDEVSVSGISRHGSYSTNLVTVSSDNQHVHQQGVDWSAYQPPNKLFISPSTCASHHSQPQPQSSYAGANIPSLIALASDSPLLQASQSGSSGGGEGQSLYTPESAGSILASFGLSNEDLEVLSHYPDDQLTPDTLPFILRNIQINKSEKRKTEASTSKSSISNSIQDVNLTTSHSLPLAPSRSPEVPSLLTVTQTAGKVIDYGHASRAHDERSTREAFKREPLSSERILKMFPSSPSSLTTKVDKTERHQVILEQTEPSKHGDQDYRKNTNSHYNSRPSPAREFPASSKDRNLDQDYRRDRLKQRASSESRSEESSRWSLSSSSDSKTISNSKKFPTPTMISDFSAVSPKVYPHTCSLCHTECDQEKDWVDHINTVNHTAACRDLRNKYPAWKPNLPSRSGRYGSRSLWDPKDRSPSQPILQSLSSPSSSPPLHKHQVLPLSPHGKPYSPHSHFYHHHYTEHRFDYQYSSKHSSSHLHHASYTKDHRPDKRKMESRENSSRSSVKCTYDDATRNSVRNRQLLLSKQGAAQSATRPIKSGAKPGTKSAKSSSTKKKKTVTQPSKECSVTDRLVYLIGIPNDASEQEVTNLVGSFGKINNVILMPCSNEKSERSEGQKASVCMVKAKDAQALANCKNLSIRDQNITSLVAKKPVDGHCSSAKSSKLALGQDKIGAGEGIGDEADQKISVEKGRILITGLPESGWLESDIITLIEPYGIPSDIIMAEQNGKVLVSVPDCETAEEIVKIHTFVPAKIRNKEVKMIYLKQRICLSTPVTLYNILMGSEDPVESPSPVTWSNLLVINNVPSLSASSEVQKLVQRFGTVIRTLVLKNMIICEMATAAMALSVYKRFQTFPCIIQNNPLFFSRKPDSKARTKVIAAYADSSEGSQMTAAVNKRETAYEEKTKSHLKEMHNDPDGNGMRSTEKMFSENEALGKNKQTNITKDGSNYMALSDNTLERGETIYMEESSTPIPVLETLEDYKEVSAADAKHDKTLAVEETKLCSSNGKSAFEEKAASEIHKQVTQEMVKALLVECRAKIGYQPNNTAPSTCGEQPEIQMLPEHVEKADKETKKQTKKPSQEHQEEEKTQQRQRTERQTRKEKERREKEKRAKGEREQDDRIRKDRDKKEDERKKWERRERKRGYDRSFSGDALSFRSQGCKQSSLRVNNDDGSKAMPKMEEQEEFPLNISDFVTVDEVGDVTDLPCSLSAVTLETTGGGHDASAIFHPDTLSDTPTEAITDTTSNTIATLVMPDNQVSECETQRIVVAKTLYSQVVNASPEQSMSRQTPMTCQVGATESQTASSNPPEDAFEGFLNCPGQGVSNSDSGSPLQIIHEKGRNTVNGSQAEEERMFLHKTNEHDKMQDKKGEDSFTETGYACQASIRDECVKKVLKTEVAIGTDYYLPPFDPNHPVGMEFLVPKTGFFCKACNRFFSGNKDAEINHCKTLKHYKNLQSSISGTLDLTFNWSFELELKTRRCGRRVTERRSLSTAGHPKRQLKNPGT